MDRIRLPRRCETHTATALSRCVQAGVVIMLATSCCQAEDRRQASQQFRVIVPPRMEVAHDSSGSVNQFTLRANIDLLVRWEQLSSAPRVEQSPVLPTSVKPVPDVAADRRQTWRVEKSTATVLTLPADHPTDRGLHVMTIVPLD